MLCGKKGLKICRTAPYRQCTNRAAALNGVPWPPLIVHVMAYLIQQHLAYTKGMFLCFVLQIQVCVSLKAR